MTGHKLSDTKQASTRKLINIMRRLARDLPFKDNATNTAITEAADRLEELQIESDMHSMGFRKVRDNEVKLLISSLAAVIIRWQEQCLGLASGHSPLAHSEIKNAIAVLGYVLGQHPDDVDLHSVRNMCDYDGKEQK